METRAPAAGTAPGGEISVEGASAGGLDPTTTVEVRRYNSGGGLIDYGDGLADGFHIAVIC